MWLHYKRSYSVQETFSTKTKNQLIRISDNRVLVSASLQITLYIDYNLVVESYTVRFKNNPGLWSQNLDNTGFLVLQKIASVYRSKSTEMKGLKFSMVHYTVTFNRHEVAALWRRDGQVSLLIWDRNRRVVRAQTTCHDETMQIFLQLLR